MVILILSRVIAIFVFFNDECCIMLWRRKKLMGANLYEFSLVGLRLVPCPGVDVDRLTGQGTSRIDSNKCGGARVLTGVLLAYRTASYRKNPCPRPPSTPDAWFKRSVLPPMA